MRITIIGSGNVATHMAAAFKNAGHKIVQVYSPSYQNAALLAYHVKADAISDLKDVNIETDIFLIAVKDDAIESVAMQLSAYQKLTVHTSGATELMVLQKLNEQSGVLYPLQTFSKIKELDFWQVPLCIEGANELITLQLEDIARTVSNQVYRVNSQQRKILHLAAVFACNFANNLYAVAQQLLETNNLSFDLVKPLILETAQKVQLSFPADVQTGPAIRNDETTMAAHLKLLDQTPALQELYVALSQSIIKMGLSAKPDK